MDHRQIQRFQEPIEVQRQLDRRTPLERIFAFLNVSHTILRWGCGCLLLGSLGAALILLLYACGRLSCRGMDELDKWLSVGG